MNPAYLISALNLLNEAEINYKMARNKRLHVEMTMIKLTFLQQAIELSYDKENGSIVKKKRVNGPVAIRFEPLQGSEIKAEAPYTNPALQETKLYIQSEPEPKKLVSEPVPVAERKTLLKEAVKATQVVTATTDVDVLDRPEPVKVKPATGKRSLLDSLRDQHNANTATDNTQQAIPVTLEAVQDHWNCFRDKLKQKNKNSSATVFSQAKLEVVNDEGFTVTVSTNLEQKFIEQEKITLLEYLKDCFQNKNIGFTILINENPEDKEPVEQPLTSREKYKRLVEKYPMIKELKDRLKLELE